MKRLALLTPLLAAVGIWVLGSGCHSGPVYKRGLNFSAYHTFAILPLPDRGTYQDPTIVSRLGGPAVEAVVQTLTRKGFQQVPKEEADFYVRMLFDYLPEKNWMETRMFAIQILDAKSKNKEVLWSDFWRRTTDTTLPQEAVRKEIAEMLKPFPPLPK